MTRLSYRLALSTAIVTQLLAVAPASAETDPLSVNRTHPGQMAWAPPEDGRPMDLRPGSRGDGARAAEQIVGQAEAPAAGVAEMLGKDTPKPRRRKDRVDFEPRFAIDAPSRRPRYEAPAHRRDRATVTQVQTGASDVREESVSSGMMRPRRERGETAADLARRTELPVTMPVPLVPVPVPAPPRPRGTGEMRPMADDAPALPSAAPGALATAAPRPSFMPRPHPLRPWGPIATIATAAAVADQAAIAADEAVSDAMNAPPPHRATAEELAARVPTPGAGPDTRDLSVASSDARSPDGAGAPAQSVSSSEAADGIPLDDAEPNVASLADVADPDALEPELPVDEPAVAPEAAEDASENSDDEASAATEQADREVAEAGEDGAQGDGDVDGASASADGDGDHEGDRDGEAEEPPARVDNTPIPPGPTPFQLVRMMTALQDDIARGSSTALQAQRVLGRRIGERFRASAPREWADPANGRALVTYALSGGDPSVVRDVVGDAWLEGEFVALAKGALAFIEGREEDAKHHFNSLEGSEVARSVLGSMRLAQAALAVGRDRGQAMDFLSDARLTAPGTLVEEAALRRAILLAAEDDDLTAFEHMVSRYLRKFRSSVYAGNFRRRLAAALTRMSFIDDPDAIARLDPLFEPMSADGRQELFLLIARAAIENGSHEATRTAATRVLDTAVDGTLDHARAELYRAAAEIVVSDRLEGATEVLQRLRNVELPEDDRSLLEAALRLSQTVVTLPEPSLDVPLTAETPMIASHGGEAGAKGNRADAAPDEAMEADIVSADAPEELDEDDPLGPPLEVERRVAAAISSIDTLLENGQ